MKDKTVLLFSAGRTGSTFVYQIMKEIFDDVEKLHRSEMINDFIDKDYDCVVTLRNVVDAYLSRLRTVYCGGDPDLFMKRIKDVSFLFSDMQSYRDELISVKKVFDDYKGRVLALSYEKFINNHDFVIDCFESFFGIEVSEKERSRIKQKCSKKENLKKQDQLKNFSDVDPESNIHGFHIWSEKEDYSKELIDPIHYDSIKRFLLA